MAKNTGRPIDRLLREQEGVVANWQLEREGVPRSTVAKQVAGLRTLVTGVHLSGHAAPTLSQRARAACLSTPGARLAGWAALELAGLEQSRPRPIEVVRVGSRGPHRYPSPGAGGFPLHVRYSGTLEGDAFEREGIATLRVSRVVRDLFPSLSVTSRDRLIREVLRRGLTSDVDLWAQVAKHPGGRGVDQLRALVARYAPLGLGRERSDAEVVARALLHAAGVTDVEVNVLIAGAEADLVRRQARLIIELDGPQYHQFLPRDAAIQAAWERANWVVRRLPTDDAYAAPDRIVAAATAPVSAMELARTSATRSADDILARWSEHGRYEWSGR